MIKQFSPLRPGQGLYILNPGEVAFATSPCLIKTILGSCVGVSLHNPRLGIGGMCHYLLARAPEGERSTRYGNIALPALIRQFVKEGSRPDELVATVAGGSLMLRMKEVFFVGSKNIELADKLLDEYRIRVVRREVGGDRGRRMFMHTDSGEVSIEFITELDPELKNII